jgi:hypothetical protein
MVPKYPMRKIHPSNNSRALGWTFPFGKYFFFLLQFCANLHWKTYISKKFSFFLVDKVGKIRKFREKKEKEKEKQSNLKIKIVILL